MDQSAIFELITRFTFGSSASTIVNSSILVLFAFGLALIVRGWIRIRRERSAVLIVRRIFGDAIKGREQELLERVKESPISRKSLVVRAINTVQEVKQFQGNIDTLSDALQALYVPRSTWSRYIASILIILGLMGTIIGLSYAVLNLRGILVSMGGSLTQSGFESVIQEILGSLGFMETAFSTTLFGFGSYLILASIDHAYQTSRESLAEDFSSFVSNLLIPFFTPEEEADDFGELVRILKISVSSMNEAAGNIDALLSLITSNQETYGQMADNLHIGVQNLHGAQEELVTQYDRVNEMTGNFFNITQDLIDERKQYQQVIDDLFRKLGGDRSEIEKLYRNVDSSIRRLTDSFEKGMIEAAANNRVTVDLQNQEIERIEADHDSVFRAMTGQLSEMFGRYEAMLGTVRQDSQDNFRAMTGQLSEVFTEYRDMISAVRKDSQDILTESANSNQRILADGIVKAEEMLEAQGASYDEELKTIMQSVSEATHSIEGFKDSFTESIENALESLSTRLSSHEAELADKLQGSMSGILSSFSRDISKIVTRIESNESAASNLNTAIAALTASQKQFAGIIEDGLEPRAGSTDETILTGNNILKLEYLYLIKRLRTIFNFLGIRG